jgi:uncharacterized protein YjgD (DUF1641 family)
MVINMSDENTLESYETGVSFRDEQINKLVKTLKQLIEDKLLFQKMAEAGNKYKAEELSDDFCKELNKIFDELKQ